MNSKFSSFAAATVLMLAGCQAPSPSSSHDTGATGHSSTGGKALAADPFDRRTPLPLLPHMAAHQRENMRDHLAAVQEIVASLSAGDFPGVERGASRIGYSEQMGRMCSHMGAGAPGFTELALNFHRTADTITAAAKTRDTAATLKAVSATLQTCVGCHAIYRQHIVDDAAWKAITGSGAPTKH